MLTFLSPCLYKIPQNFAKVTLQFIATKATEVLQLGSVKNGFKKPLVSFCVTMQHFEQQLKFCLNFLERSSLECQNEFATAWFCITRLTDWLTFVVIRLSIMSRASYRLHVFLRVSIGSLLVIDWSVQSDCFYNTRLKTAVIQQDKKENTRREEKKTQKRESHVRFVFLSLKLSFTLFVFLASLK